MNSEIISKENVLKDLYSKQRFGIKPGLERTLELCREAGNPQHKFKSVHVAGTNGKGSVCSALASVMQEAGYKTGLYTSPHLIDFNERIRIKGAMISDEKLIEYYTKLKNISDETSATFFEITTIMAFMHFAESKVDIAVIETGMGGRFDSTNVLNPLLTIITKIDTDHQEYLGDTIRKITYEKAGIIKPDSICIISKNHIDVYEEIELNAMHKNLIYADLEFQINKLNINKELITTWEISGKDFDDFTFEYPVPGTNQSENLKTVFCTINELRKYYKIENDAILKGLQNIRENSGLRARIEVLKMQPLTILDGSHNENSIENLFKTLSEAYPHKKWNMIFSVMADKQIDNVLELIANNSESIIIPQLKTERASNNIVLAEKLRKYGIGNVTVADSVKTALVINQTKKDILIFGSFYLAGEVLELGGK